MVADPKLSHQEQLVAARIADGQGYKHIAAELGIARSTVCTIAERVARKIARGADIADHRVAIARWWGRYRDTAA